MGKVDAFSIEGLEAVFYPNDHLPAHLHVRKTGEWEIKVFILTTTDDQLDYAIKWPKSFNGPRSNTRKVIRQKVADHNAELLEEWEEKVNY